MDNKEKDVEEILRGRMKDCRTSLGLTQRDIAHLQVMTTSAYAKYEQGKNNPCVADLVGLSKTLDTSITYLTGLTDENMPEMVIDGKLFGVLPPKSTDAAKPVCYAGCKEVAAGMAQFSADRETAIRLQMLLASETTDLPAAGEALRWHNENHFLLMVHKTSGKICAIRDYGRYQPSPADVMVCTDYIPFDTVYDTPSEADLKELADHALAVYQKDVGTARAQAEKFGKKPIILLESCGLNDYIAYDIDNNKPVMVMGYKTYEDGYHTQAYYVSERAEVSGQPEYYVSPPTKEYIDTLGLDLYLSAMEHTRWWDTWREEPPLAYVNKDDPKWSAHKRCVSTYNRLVKLINIGRQAEYHTLRMAFDELSGDRRRLENLTRLPNVPQAYVDDLLVPIKRRIRAMEKILRKQGVLQEETEEP